MKMSEQELDDEVTLDTWKPSTPEKKLIPSKWRQEQMGNNYNQDVGGDELKKIKSALNKKFPDHEIMQAYGISAQTLVDIKEGRINPHAGITRGTLNTVNEFDEINSILKKISAVQARLYGINCAFRELAKILYGDKDQQKEFLKLLEKKRINAKKEPKDDEED
jgi:hypothetical protein